jgi:microcystin-dependent protein
MADAKITELPAIASMALGDLLPVVDDPAGTPATMKGTLAQLLSLVYPVGITISLDGDPNTLIGGTWTEVGAGRFPVGLNTGDADFDTIGKTGGAKTVTLTEAQIPAHTHTQTAHGHAVNDPGHTHVENSNNTTTGGLRGWGAADTSTNTSTATGYSTASAQTGLTVNDATAVNENTGGGEAHSNLPPYLVERRWKRTA